VKQIDLLKSFPTDVLMDVLIAENSAITLTEDFAIAARQAQK